MGRAPGATAGPVSVRERLVCGVELIRSGCRADGLRELSIGVKICNAHFRPCASLMLSYGFELAGDAELSRMVLQAAFGTLGLDAIERKVPQFHKVYKEPLLESAEPLLHQCSFLLRERVGAQRRLVQSTVKQLLITESLQQLEDILYANLHPLSLAPVFQCQARLSEMLTHLESNSFPLLTAVLALGQGKLDKAAGILNLLFSKLASDEHKAVPVGILLSKFMDPRHRKPIKTLIFHLAGNSQCDKRKLLESGDLELQFQSFSYLYAKLSFSSSHLQPPDVPASNSQPPASLAPLHKVFKTTYLRETLRKLIILSTIKACDDHSLVTCYEYIITCIVLLGPLHVKTVRIFHFLLNFYKVHQQLNFIGTVNEQSRTQTVLSFSIEGLEVFKKKCLELAKKVASNFGSSINDNTRNNELSQSFFTSKPIVFFNKQTGRLDLELDSDRNFDSRRLIRQLSLSNEFIHLWIDSHDSFIGDIPVQVSSFIERVL